MTKALTLAQQRRRTENCTTCKGWGFVPGISPMKICDCVERTDHSRYRRGAPAGTKVFDYGGGAAVTKAEREAKRL